MSLNELLAKNRDAIQRIATKHGVVRLRMFGSVAPATQRLAAMSIFWSKQGPIRAPGFLRVSCLILNHCLANVWRL